MKRGGRAVDVAPTRRFVTETHHAGNPEENRPQQADSEEARMSALRLLFSNKYVQQTPDLAGTGQPTTSTLPTSG
jgi:hypothetical protein